MMTRTGEVCLRNLGFIILKASWESDRIQNVKDQLRHENGMFGNFFKELK